MKILRIVLQVIAFAFVLGYPSRMDSQLYIFLNREVSIKVNKNYPSYIAYDAVNIKKAATPIAKSNEPVRTIRLSTESTDEIMDSFHPLAKKVVLNTIIIKKDIQVFNTQAVNDNYIRTSQFAEPVAMPVTQPVWDQKNWVAEFKPYFRKKVEEGTLAPSWSQGGGRIKSVRVVAEASADKVDVDKKSVQEKPTYTDATSKALGTQNRIIGAVEFKNGLALSNEFRIEIRRYEEGIFREKGTYNLQESAYEIFPNDFRGFLLGRLIDNHGRTLGEGVVRVSDTVLNKVGAHKGPTIYITPRTDVNGRMVSSYDAGGKSTLAQTAKATIFQGHMDKTVGADGQIKFNNIVRNSPTNLIAESKGHFTAQQIILAGENFSIELIPEKMGVALKQIVSDLRQQNLNDPHLSIVMGKVTFDGQPVSGVTVKVEDEIDAQPIYFNALMLPDPRVTATSENGYYAFIVEGGDLKTLMAYRGDKYFGHINTVVSPGMTSFVEIQNTIKTDNVEIKVYDPFSGLAEFSDVSLQGQSETLTIDKGIGEVQLPYLGRWSFLYSNPTDKFVPAHYTYVEKSDYIYVPLISREWITYAFSSQKISTLPSTNLIVGFVIDEDFEVEIPGIDSAKNYVMYFDYSGKVVERGYQGGGYIIYNLPEGIYEPLVFGTKSQKVYSRIAPLKTNDLFVFTYKLDGSM